MKLRWKILINFGMFLFLVVLGFWGLNAVIVKRTLRDNAYTNVKRSVESVNASIESMLTTTVRSYLRSVVDQDILVLIALNQRVRHGELTELEAKDAFQAYVRKQVIGKSGYIVALKAQLPKIVLEIHPFMRGKDCAGNKGCQVWISQKDGYNEYDWRNPADKKHRKKVGYIRYFEPWDWVVGATSYKDEFTELVSADDFRQITQRYSVLDRGYFFVMDGNRNMLIHPVLEGQNVGQTREEEKRISDEIIKHTNDFYHYRWRNEEKFACVQKLANFDWYLVASGYVADVKAPIQNIMRMGYLLILLVALILVGMVILFSNRLTRPLHYLIAGIRDFEVNRRVFKMSRRSVLEIDEVGHAVEKMTRSLLDSEKENRNLVMELDSILNSMPSILAVVNTSGKVVFWNQNAETSTGIPRSKAIHSNISDVLSLFEPEMDTMLHHVRAQTDYRSVVEIEAQKGLKAHFEIFVCPLPKELQFAVIRIDDISEKVKMEQALLQARKMDAVGNLAGGVAHDFNNMLSGILGAAQILETRLDNPEKAKANLKVIRDSALRAAGLTHNLLTFSRKEVRKAAPLSIHTAIKETVSILKRSIDKKIELITDLKCEYDIVNGDYSELQSAFLNLGVNASHAMPDGGTLIFRSSLSSADELNLNSAHTDRFWGRYIHIEVADTGVGIPAHLIDKVVEPFFTTRAAGKGTGLGLSSVYGLAKQLNGNLSISSEEGKGTTVSINLPLHERKIKTQAPAAPEESVKGTGTILVVEDEPMLREIAEINLRGLGYMVFSAENGKEGIKAFQAHRDEIDLVLLDMIMPVMGGKECLEALRGMDPELPVVIASGYSKDDDIIQLEKDFEFAFLTKPYDNKVLSRVISETMRNASSPRSQTEL